MPTLKPDVFPSLVSGWAAAPAGHAISSIPDEGADESEKGLLDIPDVIGILPVRDVVLFPGTTLPLAIGRSRSMALIQEVENTPNPLIGILTQKDKNLDDPTEKDFYEMGCLGRVVRVVRLNQYFQIIILGLIRFRVEEFVAHEPCYKARVTVVPEPRMEDSREGALEAEALNRAVKSLLIKLIETNAGFPNELKYVVHKMEGPGRLADLAVSLLEAPYGDKQAVLEAVDIKLRLAKAVDLLTRELEIAKVGKEIEDQVSSKLGKSQREIILREQLRAIQSELGEEDEHATDLKEIKERIGKAGMPRDVEREALKEITRLERMPQSSAEYATSRNYIDWLVELPWAVSTTDNLDIGQARAILDQDHYNLEKVKERILEYLAVRKLKHDTKGPILCFVGPPGTGKTSLGRSIARAMGRQFVRVSLGGIRDEAEIRGHRRTYVGALPGRILQEIRRAHSNNPLFMLDEIDKVGTDFRGDPSAALLEVLDPEQNFGFVDHYLDVPFDLSRVMFITTANILDTIPPALHDRFEVLELPGYTEEEKLAIVRRFLLPKQVRENGLSRSDVSIATAAIRKIIVNYTREAGLRNLEREIARICRKVARKVAEEGRNGKVAITPANLESFLGLPRFLLDESERLKQPGVAMGLAWTPAGGDLLFVEATVMPGSGALRLTGKLGDVMKESAETALSYVRSHSSALGLTLAFFKEHDLHIHVPSGAIPKDGPSAGITIVASLYSLLRKKPLRPRVAMTGEITLRGKILPVGGIKEKVLAARRSGIRTVLMPVQNGRDLEEIPATVLKGLRIKLVGTIDEALEEVLGRDP